MTDVNPQLESKKGSNQRLNSQIPGTSSFGSEDPSITAYSCQSRFDECSEPKYTPDPQLQLAWLGYEQELSRSWDFLSSLSLGYCNTGLMVQGIVGISSLLDTGGTAVLIWGSLLSSTFVTISMAVIGEMASAYPVAGAMYTWTFKLARASSRLRNYARYISWLVGFLLIVVHLVTSVQISRYFSTLPLASGYRWKYTKAQATAISIAYCAICGVFSCFPIAHSRRFWKAMGIVVLGLNISSCIVLLTTSRNWKSLSTVLTDIQSPTNNKFWSVLFAWIRATVVMSSESSAHMAEETRNPAKNVPRALFGYGLINIFLGFLTNLCIALVRLLFPYLGGGGKTVALMFVHLPAPAASFVTIAILIMSVAQVLSHFVGATRFFWALGRDKALPFGKFWSRASQNGLPTRAAVLVVLIAIGFHLILFEPRRFFVVIAADGAGLLTSFVYIIPMSIYLFFSEKGVYDRDGRNVWNLGVFSKPLTVVSIMFFLLVAVVTSIPFDFKFSSYTWAAPFSFGAFIVATVSWFFYGRSHYVGPVKSLTIWTVGQAVEVPKKLTEGIEIRKPISTHQSARDTSRTMGDRSAANMTGGAINTFDAPHTYHSYGTAGSMWSQSNEEQTMR
ncbi:amino acid permease-domain-containing protein [Phakopsora pachyrhizi]|uniref:Amino acid permease-domain-containing protein n=1 Tax=Phakopsora pachyrhizi TaxID=170000 RepID=A0AAV0BQ08_PHAPC|nr:amino acid permease-domain-containing protein [Phakopsora pachyrhizi]